MDLVIRTAVVFLFLQVLIRVIGRRELSTIEPFDVLLLVILGDAVQQGLTQDDYSVVGALLVIGTFAVLQVFVSWLAFRFPRTRGVLRGEPMVIVQDGEVIDRNLKRERLTRGEIAEEARKQQIGTLADVQWAVLETSGQISFIKKS